MKKLWCIFSILLVVAIVLVGTSFVYTDKNTTNGTDSPIISNPDSFPFNLEPDTDSPIDDDTRPSSDGMNPVMWEVSAKNGNGHIYFLGAIHVGDGDMTSYCDAVKNAYEESDYLAVECDIVDYENDYSAQMKMLQAFMCPLGTDVENYLSEQTYASMMTFFANHGVANLDLYKAYKPAMWSSLLSNVLSEEAGLSSDYGVDRYFLNAAKKTGKTILEIESIEFQNNLSANVSDELSDFMIKYGIRYFDEDVAYLKDLIKYYKIGNLEKMIEIQENETDYETDMTPEEEEKIEAQLDAYNKAMLDDRNVGMANKAIEYLESGKSVFYVVGLAHMIDQANIFEQLEQQGYEVKRVN